jgi:hypothetical protein
MKFVINIGGMKLQGKEVNSWIKNCIKETFFDCFVVLFVLYAIGTSIGKLT